MRKIFSAIIRLLVISLSLTALSPASQAQVAINEFLADPARDWDGDGQYNYRDDEWVEVVNFGETPVDLSGYRLSDGEGEPVWRYGFSGVLEPGGIRVIYGSDSRAWEESNDFPIYGLSLNNAGDRISLFRVSGTETLVVDAFTYNDHAAEDDRSVGRTVHDPDCWAVFDAYNPCPENSDPSGNGCVPTPGLANECRTGSEYGSWGKIKNKFH